MSRNLFDRAFTGWANLHPALRILAILIILGIVGLFGLKPGYRVFKQWRVTRNLVAAEEAVKESRMAEARDLSLSALRSGDASLEAYRILEKSMDALRDPRHGDIAKALAFHPDSKRDDRLTGFRSIADGNPLGLVGQAWVQLPARDRTDPSFITIFASRLISEKRLDEASMVLLSVPENKRSDVWNRDLAKTMIAKKSAAGYSETQTLAAQVIASGTGKPLDWIQILEEIPPLALQADLMEPVREILEDRAATEDDARFSLMLSRISFTAEPSRQKEIIDSAIQQFKGSDPLALADFLGDLGLHDLVLKTFDDDFIRAHSGLFGHLLRSLRWTASWERLVKLLDEVETQMAKPEELTLRAIAALEAGDIVVSNQNWTQAKQLAATSTDPNMLLKISRMMSSEGYSEQADEALIDAIRSGKGNLPLFSELQPLILSLEAKQREDVMLEIIANYLAFEPSNPVILVQYAYLAVMNDLVAPEKVMKVLEQMSESFPDQIPIQRVIAILQVIAGETDAAALIFLKNPPSGSSPAEYIMAGLVNRVMNGEISAKEPEIKNFAWNQLLPSERKKFGELLRSAK